MTLSKLSIKILSSESLFLNCDLIFDFRSGKQPDSQLVHILVNESPNAAQFLTDLGVDLSLITQCGAHSVLSDDHFD